MQAVVNYCHWLRLIFLMLKVFPVLVLKFNSIEVFQNENNRSYSEIFAPSQETSKVFMRPFPLYK